MAKATKRPLHLLKRMTFCVISATSIASAGVVNAQTAETSPPDLEEIVVTGSRIPRRDFFSPSPISTVDRTTLESAAQPTLEEALNQIPQITPDFGRTANNPGNGTARINLRGLGSNRTLVLLNGRRLAPSGVGSSVDVNNLPQSLIDRVEIVTGGASTVYGSDAVAGVVNFVTRTDFDGFASDVTAYTSERGDGNIVDLNVSFGHNFANGKGNIAFYGDYYDRSSIFASERTLTAVPIQDANGMLTESGSRATPSSVITFPPVDFGNGPAITTFDENGLPVEFLDPEDRYNFAPLSYLQTPLVRTAAGVLLNYSVSDRNEFYAEFGYTKNESKQNLAPVPVSNLYLTNLDNPLLDPTTQQFFATNYAPPFLPPGTAGLFLSRRMEELGPRIFDVTRNYSRVVAGFRGEVNDDWNYDVWSTYTKGEEDTVLLNGASDARFQQGLFVNPVSGQCSDTSNGCVPLNIWGAGNLSAEGAEFIRLPDLVNSTSREQKLVSGYVRGAPIETWAGAVELAIGAEWRSDSGTFVADSSLFSGEALGFRGSAGIDGRESVYEVYAEAVVPLVNNMKYAEYIGVELGARYSDYDSAGSVDTYKIGADWTLIEGLRFRTMFQHSVRAPSIGEAFQEQFIETFAYVNSDPTEDLCSASADPVGNGNVDACIATGLPESQIGIFEASVGVQTDIVRGGNPNLTPEAADTFTLGVVASIGENEKWQLSVDYFDLEIADTIGDLPVTVACFDPANIQNLFCGNFTRDPNNFNVIRLVDTNANLGGQRTTGFDTQIKFDAEIPNVINLADDKALFTANLVWTHARFNNIRALSFGSRLRCAGHFGFPCNDATDGLTFPKDRISANFAHLSGDLGLYLNWRWMSGTDNAALLLPEFGALQAREIAITDIGSISYFDLGVSYQLSDRIRARLNVSNLLDRDPPLMANAVISNNTDTRLYDVFGRSYSLTLSYRH